MANGQNLLVGNPTSAGQGFRAPGFDALTSFTRAGQATQDLSGGGPAFRLDLPIMGGAAGGPLLDPKAIQELLEALRLENEPQEAPGGVQGAPVTFDDLLGLLFRSLFA